MRILYKVLLSFLVITLLIGFVGLFSVIESKKALKESIVSNSHLLAGRVLEEVDRNIHNRIELLQSLCAGYLVRKSLEESNRRFDELDDVQGYINEIDRKWLSASEWSWNVPISETLSEELIDLCSFLENEYGYNVFGEIFVTNKYGVNIAMSRKTSDYRQDDEEWWQAARKNGLNVTDVEYDRSADMYSIDFSIAILNNKNEFTGVLKAVFNIKGVINIIKQLDSSSNARERFTRFHLLKKDLKPIYSTNEGLVAGASIDVSGELSGLLSGSSDYVIRHDSRNSSHELLTVLAESRGFKDYKGLGWILVIDQSTDEIFAPVEHLKEWLIFISIAVMLLAAVISFFLSKYIAGPILKLRDTAISIGEGNWDVGLDVDSSDEIGELADSFKNMIRKLTETTTSIEKLDQEIQSRKRVEEELRESHEELENTFAQLKQAHVQMLHSEKMASVGQLAAGVAHEINNPAGFVSSNLNTLSGYIDDIGNVVAKYRVLMDDLKAGIEQLQSDGILKDIKSVTEAEETVDMDGLMLDIKDLMQESLDGVERIRNIVLNLKDFAHPGEEESVPSDLNKCLDTTINVLWNELKYKADVVKEYGKIPAVECYPQQINQVFMNILVNAAQAFEEKGVITVSTAAYDGSVEIKIADDGPGIPEENIKKIFDPFFTTKEVGQGTGLGLNISYNIIEKHNGVIDVESESGKGTAFIIRLPVNFRHEIDKPV